jgi:predicted nucleic acid-binding protein
MGDPAACAKFAQAEAIVSGDDDLLSLQHFAGIPIVDVHAALANLDRRMS